MKLKTAIDYMGADAPQIDPVLAERDVISFSIDSREVATGDVFFALAQPDYANNGFNGEFADATQFAAAALESGAVACVLRRDRFDQFEKELKLFGNRLIFADDTIVALQKLAHGIYLEWNKPVVAITGSAGKTTAKELTAHVLAGERKVLRNIKNYNNGLGHPLTVLNLAKDKSYDVAVLEMGMSTPRKEIARLCQITPPDVAVELNVLPVHVEHLGSIENVAAAKAELVEGMKVGGTAVLNADDNFVMAMAGKSRGQTLTYGIENKADVSAANIEFARFGETRFRLHLPSGQADVTFQLNGRHNILNALAAAAVGHIFGMTVEQIAERLRTVSAPAQRGEVLHFVEGFTVINDSYNSNPAALLSMAKTLIDGSKSGERTIIVAGEMLELGENASAIHFETGQAIGKLGVDIVIGVRGLASELVNGVKNAGGEAFLTENADDAGEMLAKIVKAGDVVLVKGSRGVRTEKTLDKLTEVFNIQH